MLYKFMRAAVQGSALKVDVRDSGISPGDAMLVYVHVRDEKGECNTPILEAIDAAVDNTSSDDNEGSDGSGDSDDNEGSDHGEGSSGNEGSGEGSEDNEGSDGY
jgi:hypothetical protein